MSPFHVHIMKRSRVESKSGWQYKIVNDERTRFNANFSDFYSLGITALSVIGQNCREPADALCQVGKEVVTMHREFPHDAQAAFTEWDPAQVKTLLLPYWRKVQQLITEYRDKYPTTNTDLMQLLAAYLLVDPDYFS